MSSDGGKINSTAINKNRLVADRSSPSKDVPEFQLKIEPQSSNDDDKIAVILIPLRKKC